MTGFCSCPLTTVALLAEGVDQQPEGTPPFGLVQLGSQPGGCILRVEKDGVVIYDSALDSIDYYHTYSQASKTLDDTAYVRTYPLGFSDGSATLYVYGYFDFFVDEAVRTFEFWLCLLLGIGILLWAVWKKLNYMETLEEGIRVLEGGQLDYQVPTGTGRAGPDGPEPERDERFAPAADRAGATGAAAALRAGHFPFP